VTTKEGQNFNENDIRPDELMEKVKILFEKDIQRMMQHKEQFIDVPCPACGLKKSNKVFSKLGQDFELCQSCETVFVNPRPTPAILAQHYQTALYYQYWNDYIFPRTETVRREKIFRPRAQKLAGFISQFGFNTETLLEIGAGFGTFCEELSGLEIFERIIAVEPTPGLASNCRKRGIEVLELPIEQVEIEAESIDVIVSFEVVEHLFSPVDFIRKCRQLLLPGGGLILTCPNIKGFDIQVLGVESDIVEPEHLNYFTPESLAQVLSNEGYEVLDVQTPGKLDAELVRKKVLAGWDGLENQSFLRQILIDKWIQLGTQFQQFLSDNNLSSHLCVVARKL